MPVIRPAAAAALIESRRAPARAAARPAGMPVIPAMTLFFLAAACLLTLVSGLP